MPQITRKRGRNTEEECSEFMPLSKRINNLHINGFSNLHEGSAEVMDSDWGSGNLIPSPNYTSQGSPSQEVCARTNQNSNCNAVEYRPDLDAKENPFYYESNKLLFSLYVERMQRSEHY